MREIFFGDRYAGANMNMKTVVAGLALLTTLSGCVSLQKASRTGNIDALVKALDGGKDANTLDSHGRPLLTIAAAHGQLAVMRTLIERDADLELPDQQDMRPLFVAAAANQLPAVQELVVAGADLESLNTAAELTPLMPATEQGYKATVEYLLARGATPTSVALDGQTALSRLARLNPQSSQSDIVGTARTLVTHLRDQSGNPAVVRYLDHQDASGYTALHRAALSNNAELTAFLLQQGASPLPTATLPDQTELQPLDLALDTPSGLAGILANTRTGLRALTTRSANADPLLEEPADEEPEITGWSVLHSAAQHCQPGNEVFRTVLAATTQPAARSSDEQTVLHLLARCHEEMSEDVRLLLERVQTRGTRHALKAYLDTPAPRTGETVLYMATATQRPAMVKVLLAAGATPDKTGASGERPLFAAIRHGNTELVTALLKAKASTEQPDEQGIHPLSLAVELRHAQIAEALLAAGARPNVRLPDSRTPLHQAVASGQAEVVKALLAARANPDLTLVNSEETPLHLAIAQGNLNVADQLLSARAAPSPRRADRATPLSMALAAGNLDLARLLLARGASPDLTFDDNDTLLHRAARDGNEPAYELLLAFAANTTLRNADGKTALTLRTERLEAERKAFLAGLENAGRCLEANNPQCASSALTDIQPLIRDPSQQSLWDQTQADVQAAAQRLAELRAAQEAERQRQEAEAKRRASEARTRAFMAIAGTAYIASNADELGSDNAGRMINAWNQDVLSGDAGMTSMRSLQQSIQQENQLRHAEVMRRLAEQRERERREEAARHAQIEREAQALRAQQAEQLAMAAQSRAAAEQQRQQAERERAEQERVAEQQRRAEAAEAERQRRAAAATAERERQAEERRRATERLEQERRQAYQNWLLQKKNGTRLGAKSCDGKDQPYRLVGTLPSIPLPQIISHYTACVTVHYEARCPGTPRGAGLRGSQYNFTGMGAGCLSAEGQMSRTLPCEDRDVIVETLDVTACGG